MLNLLKAYRDRRRKQQTIEQYETATRDINAMYARIFKTKEGQIVLEHMVSTQMAVSIAQMGDDLITIGERQGRSNHVNEIVQRIEYNS